MSFPKELHSFHHDVRGKTLDSLSPPADATNNTNPQKPTMRKNKQNFNQIGSFGKCNQNSSSSTNRSQNQVYFQKKKQLLPLHP
jgi:hypothetical protein